MHSRRNLLIAIVVALLAGGAILWSQVKREFIPRRFAAVDPGIYRSGQIDDGLIEKVLREHRIALVIMMLRNDGTKDAQVQESVMQRLGIESVQFPLSGNGTGNPLRYADALVALNRARQSDKPVLIHCASGTERTGGVVALYRVLLQGRSPKEAHAELCEMGHDDDRNPKLTPFLNDNMQQIAERLVERGALERVPSPLPVLGP